FADLKTPTKATADGFVAFAGFENDHSYGNLVTIQHDYGFQTSYAHLYDVWVKSGDFVRKGDVIGRSGNSGLSSGPHLHYEVRFVQRAIDPMEFINWDTKNLDPPFTEKQTAWPSLINQVSQQINRLLPLPLGPSLNQGNTKPL
ncbi:MAG TPA: M23 family metallopeptidase, partial [Magnetococcales bacterium]|nr:M23 family metallopeptidase [Magnetococcales bacterium]